MKQQSIYTIAAALHRADTAIAGATEIGVAIGIKQNTAAVITVDRAALVTARDGYETAVTTMKNRRTTVDSAKATAHAYATLVRDVLKPRLGNQYSTAWDQVGLRRSLTIPRSMNSLKFVLESYFAYFTANPTHENADLNITAARIQNVLESLRNADNDVNSQKAVVRTKLTARNAAFKALVKRLSGTAQELRQLLPLTSPDWLKFGLNIPGVQQTPEVPANVIAVLIGPNAVALKWDAAARAQSYHIWKKVVGVDEELVVVDTRTDLDATIEGLPANASIQIGISAVNNGGESQVSELVTVQTA